MSSHPFEHDTLGPPDDRRSLAPGEPFRREPVAPASRRIALPIFLFAATCLTTLQVGGWAYAVPLMLTLLAHELGHFLQALRYGVPASLPYFIPMPARPLGTMGAVIAMGGNMGNRKSLFDIGISGPLAGLVPALICSIVGLKLSHVVTAADDIGEPLLFKFLVWWIHGPLGPGETVAVHPLAFAGWVGIFITALNLFPIGQLDGGHVLYALLRRKAHIIATILLMAAIFAVVVTQNYSWLLMLVLLTIMGPNHPPTGDDDIPLGRGRTILGWLTLAFVIIGFTPRPFM